MRHRYNRLLELNIGIQKKDNVLKNMITSLLVEKRIITTPKKAKVLKYEVERLFAILVKTAKRYSEPDISKMQVKRILDSIVYNKAIIDKVINEKLQNYIENGKVSWFVRDYKVWYRKGDAVEKIMIELV